MYGLWVGVSGVPLLALGVARVVETRNPKRFRCLKSQPPDVEKVTPKPLGIDQGLPKSWLRVYNVAFAER